MKRVQPMFATSAQHPPRRADQYAYEVKWDGVRLIAYVESDSVTAYTRNDIEVSRTYPEIMELAGRRCVLDGEIVAFDADGIVSFGTLQHRMHVTDPQVVAGLMESIPALYVVFDVLAVDGNWVLDQPYTRRRALLDSIELAAPHVQVPAAIDGDGEHAMAVTAGVGAEGIVAKRLSSLYYPGRRSPDWLKVKHTATVDVIVGGFRPGKGNRAGGLGSVLVGIPSVGGLRYVGRVGTGFTMRMLVELSGMLAPLIAEESPFSPLPPGDVVREATWVRPELVAEVEYRGITADGILRQPVWRGLRVDMAPGDVGSR